MKDRWAEERGKWRGIISEQGQSGKSAAEFCRERGLRGSRFFAWKKRLREAEAGKFVSVAMVRSGEDRQAAPEPGSGAIEVRLCPGRSLVIEPGFDPHHLRALLRVLEAEA